MNNFEILLLLLINNRNFQILSNQTRIRDTVFDIRISI